MLLAQFWALKKQAKWSMSCLHGANIVVGGEEEALFWPIQSMSDGDKPYGEKNEYLVCIWLSFDLFNLFVIFESFSSFIVFGLLFLYLLSDESIINKAKQVFIFPAT